MADHYFSRNPGVAARLREVEVELGGRRLAMRTSSGVFSGDGLDHATRHLLDRLDDEAPSASPAPARVLDLGCGWGPIALALAAHWPAAEVWAVDVNERALELTARNAERHDLPVTVSLPEDVPDDLRFDRTVVEPSELRHPDFCADPGNGVAHQDDAVPRSDALADPGFPQ